MNTNHPPSEPVQPEESPIGGTPRRPHSVLDEFQQKQRAETLLLSALRAVFIVLVVIPDAFHLWSNRILIFVQVHLEQYFLDIQ